MSEAELNKFERALDASAIIALGKLVLFRLALDELKFRAGTKNPSEKELESARITMREVINQLPDETFFMPPSEIANIAGVEEYFRKMFHRKVLAKDVIAEYEKVKRRGPRSLTEYTKDP